MYFFHFHLIFEGNFYKQTVKILIRSRILRHLDLGMHCLPMSQKWDARLRWVKYVLFYQFYAKISTFAVKKSLGSAPAMTMRMIFFTK